MITTIAIGSGVLLALAMLVVGFMAIAKKDDDTDDDHSDYAELRCVTKISINNETTEI